MVCCRCNRRGLCKGCSCVKDGRPCIDCLPCREDNCHNSTPAVSIEPCPTLTGRTLGDRASQSLTRSSSTTSPSPVNVEHGSFSPLISSTSGGMGPTASVVYKRLASLLSSKHDEHYSKTILFIRSKLSFALLRSAVRCLRGARSIFKSDFGELNIGLALTEGRVTY